MAKQNVHLYGFHGGQIDAPTLARVDLQQMRLAAEVQENLLCTVTGHAFFRPGTDYLGDTDGNDDNTLFAFIKSRDAASLIEFGDHTMRVWNDGQLVTRTAVECTINGGDFATTGGWTSVLTGAASASISGGKLTLNGGSQGASAIMRNTVTTVTDDVHALRIVVERGPVLFRCGSTVGGDEYIAETSLRTGVHSLAFRPETTTFYVQFENNQAVARIVENCTIEPAGVMVIPTPYAIEDVGTIRGAQSLDVVFLACAGYQQRRLERRSGQSWSLVTYACDDGPFTALPTKAGVKLKVSGFSGNVTLTASRKFFTPGHVGGLFRLHHSGQNGRALLSAESQFTTPIRVTGISTGNNDRNWSYQVTGTWAGTLTVQRSYDSAVAGFRPYGAGITNNSSVNAGDSDDNAIIYYRIGFADGAYTSGTAVVDWQYDGGGDYGVCRVIGYTSPTSVTVEVIRPFSALTYTDDWQEGEWSDAQNWPAAVAIFDGRLWWSANDRIWGSVSDAYDVFDDTTEGDSGPIQRSIAVGLGSKTNWIMTLQRLIFGTDACEASVRSSSLDEPLTPTNLTVRTASTVGSANIDPVQVDGNALFVDGAGKRIFEMVFDTSSNDMTSTEISALVRKLFESGVREAAVQRRPDTRVYFVLEDGRCICLVYFPAQSVAAFIPLTTKGAFRSVEVLPGDEQDRVYFVVRRTINGATKHFVERMALDSEVAPNAICKVMDAGASGTLSTPSALVNVGQHLAGEQVAVWGNGTAFSDLLTVREDGVVTMPIAVTSWAAGLPYRWRYKTSRLAYAASGGTALLQPKRIDHIGIIATDFHRDGITFGPEFDDPLHPLDPLPIKESETTAPKVYNGVIYDEITVPFPGTFDTDSRVCLEGRSPYPVRLLGLVLTLSTNDRM